MGREAKKIRKHRRSYGESVIARTRGKGWKNVVVKAFPTYRSIGDLKSLTRMSLCCGGPRNFLGGRPAIEDCIQTTDGASGKRGFDSEEQGRKMCHDSNPLLCRCGLCLLMGSRFLGN